MATWRMGPDDTIVSSHDPDRIFFAENTSIVIEGHKRPRWTTNSMS